MISGLIAWRRGFPRFGPDIPRNASRLLFKLLFVHEQ
jgi:hypothetical protein